jgi:hypothetical protein
MEAGSSRADSVQIMPAHRLMSVFAIVFALLGGLALFFPEELAWRVGAPALSALLLQLLAAAYLSLAALDWIGRRAIYGGIYGRGIVMANFAHGFIASTVMINAGLRIGIGLEAWALTAVLAVQAIAFGRLLFTHPKLPGADHTGESTGS